MTPRDFPQANISLTAPEGMTTTECQTLRAHRDGKQHVSLWTASFWDRLRFLVTGRIWLGVLGAHTQPPVWLDTRDPFRAADSRISRLVNRIGPLRRWRLRRQAKAAMKQWVSEAFQDGQIRIVKAKS